MSGAAVEVIALNLPGGTTPHLELLCYRGDFPRNEPIPDVDDVAATRLVFAVASMAALQALSATHADSIMAPGVEWPGGSSWLLRDPDGHILQLEFTRSA